MEVKRAVLEALIDETNKRIDGLREEMLRVT